MAKWTKKVEEFRGKTNEDLEKELENKVQGLFNLRFQKVTDVVENPADFKEHRREIALIKTLLREREIKASKK